MRERHPAPLAGRAPAHEPITAALVAAASGVDRDLVARLLADWFTAIGDACRAGTVVVFDDFVVGPAEPLLLEARHAVRSAARAEASGVFDEMEDDWFDRHGDDDDVEPFERPSVTEWAIASLRFGWQGERVCDGRRLVAASTRARDLPIERIIEVVRVCWAFDDIVAGLANAIHIAGFPVVDARLAGRRLDGVRWAA